MGHRIIGPNNRHVHVSQISKAQMAKTINAQTRRIQQLDEHVKASCRLLITLALYPDSFTLTPGGHVEIDRVAVESIKAGTELTIEAREAAVRIVAKLPEERPPVIDVPEIIVPPGFES